MITRGKIGHRFSWLVMITLLALAGCGGPGPAPTEAPASTTEPSSTTLPEPASQAGVLFQDDFSDPSSGWPTVDQETDRFGYHPPDFYHLEVSAPEDQLTVFRGLNLGDLTVETDVLVDHTDSDSGDFRYGLALRRSGEAYYAFAVSPRRQAWQVLKHAPAGVEVLAEGNDGAIQGLSGIDRLRVDASGSTFVFSINAQPVAQVSDPDYASGDVGFFVETFDETLAHIHYDSLTIREVELAAVAAVPSPAPVAAAEPAVFGAEAMVRIDGGGYTVGLDSPRGEYAAPQQVTLGEFWIDQHEVTNADYAIFVAGTGAPPPAAWSDGAPPAGKENHPVEGVTWDQAAAFCEWANKRLPTETEWEIAARGPEGRLYPWGNDLGAVSLPAGGTYPVGSVAGNRSPFGVFDLAGNVWEWVAEPYTPVPDGHQVLRGGAYGFLKDMAYRLQGDPNVPTMFAAAGFRCAADQVGPLDTQEALLGDDFTDPGSGWPSREEETSRYGYHPPDYYHVEVSAANDSALVARGPRFDYVSVETSVFVDHTDTEDGDFRYGLALRQSGEAYYAFTVSPRRGLWQVLKHSPAGFEVLDEGEGPALQGLTAVDTLRVDASGSNFLFQINGQPVSEVSDPDYPSGDVGFFVETFDETLAHIHYDSLAINPATSVTALLGDDFTDPGSGWPSLEEETSRYGYHPPDYYHVEVSAANDSALVARGPRFNDVSVETSVFVDHTDTEDGDFRYGLALRQSGEAYYAFTVSPRRGLWQVLKHSPAGFEVLDEGEGPALQGLTAVDTLRVDASGPNFLFQINGQPVSEVSDPGYPSGDVGFFVETFDETLAHIHYDSLAIIPAEPRAEASPTPTAVPATPTPVPAPDGMAFIPAGYFQMGSSLGTPDEKPEHPVLLDAFFLDLYEVTNAQYRACVADGGCSQTRGANSYTRSGYRDDPAFADYPVVNVTWDQAAAYCGWAGKRLPTEAEWEYAAGGPENLIWPWGNAFDRSLTAAGVADTQPVGSYPGGVSPFGVHDLAGNAAEWVADVFDPNFYATSPASNPISISNSDARVYRGGGFGNPDGANYTTSRRFGKIRTFSDPAVGFRCALDAADVTAGTPAEEREALVTAFCQVFWAYKPNAACP